MAGSSSSFEVPFVITTKRRHPVPQPRQSHRPLSHEFYRQFIANVELRQPDQDRWVSKFPCAIDLFSHHSVLSIAEAKKYGLLDNSAPGTEHYRLMHFSFSGCPVEFECYCRLVPQAYKRFRLCLTDILLNFEMTFQGSTAQPDLVLKLKPNHQGQLRR